MVFDECDRSHEMTKESNIMQNYIKPNLWHVLVKLPQEFNKSHIRENRPWSLIILEKVGQWKDQLGVGRAWIVQGSGLLLIRVYILFRMVLL